LDTLVLGSLTDDPQEIIAQDHLERHCSKSSTSTSETSSERYLLIDKARQEWLGIGFKTQAATHRLHPIVNARDHVPLDAEPKTIDQLRAQLPFFWIHRSNEHESGYLTEGDPVTLHDVEARSGRIENEVHDMVREKVHLIDVENAPVRPA
jgi:hypothetical protein